MENAFTAQKLITKEVSLKVTDVRLLTAEEAANVPVSLLDIHTPYSNNEWWLATSCKNPTRQMVVTHTGKVDIYGEDVGYANGIRPVMVVSNLREAGLANGDEFRAGGEEWTVISDELALCNGCIGRAMFRSYKCLSDDRNEFIDSNNVRHPIVELNLYELSNVKEELEYWKYELSGLGFVKEDEIPDRGSDDEYSL